MKYCYCIQHSWDINSSEFFFTDFAECWWLYVKFKKWNGFIVKVKITDSSFEKLCIFYFVMLFSYENERNFFFHLPCMVKWKYRQFCNFWHLPNSFTYSDFWLSLRVFCFQSFNKWTNYYFGFYKYFRIGFHHPTDFFFLIKNTYIQN